MQTYIWKSLSVLVSFLSFFVVIPFLTSNSQLYGIYTFCISFQLFLTYADIGFLSAGQKYAAEAFARSDQKEERRILGFVGAVLLAMILPFSLVMLLFAIYPNIVLNEVSEINKNFISSLFVILAIASPIQVILQRLTQSILTIRIKEYVSSRVDLIGNIFRILSVFVFFTGGRYMIIPYFLFINIITIVCSIVVIAIIKKEESYDILDLIKSIRFSKKYFELMKKLSFSSLGLTFSWLICYELDLIYIGKIYSVEEVALYAVCFSVINFLRQFFNILYGPYSQRFNHFVALKKNEEFSNLLGRIIKYTFPLCLFVCSIMSFSSKYFILYWVGNDYIEAIQIMSVLSWFYILHFISQPGSYVCISTENYKLIHLQSIVTPIVFLGSFLILYYSGVGLLSFAISKLLMVFSGTIIVSFAISKWSNIWTDIRPFLPLILVIFMILASSKYIYPLMFPEPHKSTIGLIKLGLIMGAYGLLFSLAAILLDNTLCNIIKRQYTKWKK